MKIEWLHVKTKILIGCGNVVKIKIQTVNKFVLFRELSISLDA